MDSEVGDRPRAFGAFQAHGRFGEELVVVCQSQVRRAEKLLRETPVHTADGQVKGRPGDFVIFTESNEQYPIPPDVFFGTYEILGRVDNHYVCRRSLHARRAWPILSAFAEFNYGADRGTVAGDRGGWVYQCGEHDFGLINKLQNTKTHIVAGTVRRLAALDWDAWFRRTQLVLIGLPPVLALLALSAFLAAQKPEHAGLSHLLLVIEGALLLAGVGLAWWIKRHCWAARAAIGCATRLTRDFQIVAEMLGYERSELFPDMTIWRAAQNETSYPSAFRPEQVRELKDQVGRACARTEHEIEQCHASERRASWATLIAVATILGCILYLLVKHSEPVELAAIWLPSIVGALHTFNWSRQVTARQAAAKEFLSELQFVRVRLNVLVPSHENIPCDTATLEQLTATLRTLARMVAVHSQRQLMRAIGEDPHLPV